MLASALVLHCTRVGLVYITAVLKAVYHLDHSLYLVTVYVLTSTVDGSQQSGDVLGNNSPVSLKFLHSLVLTDLQN